MKILLLNDYATPTAGAELVTLRLRDGLLAAGHDARVFASRAQLIAGPGFADADCFGTTSRLQLLSAFANPSAARALRRELDRFQPAVVHVNMFMWQLSPSILPVLRDVPSLYYAMVYNTICPVGTKLLPDGTACEHQAGMVCVREGCLTSREWAPRMLQHARWLRGRGAFERTIAVSIALRERLEGAGVAVDDVVWPGVPATAPGSGPGTRPTATYAGRLVSEKGVDVLLRAFRQVLDHHQPKARLLVAGTGPKESTLRALASRLGLDDAVVWLGQLTPDEMAVRFATAWAHVVPSTWAEPFGVTAIEAMMRGQPVVVSASGGLAESVVHRQTGLHVPPSDENALAGALGELLTDRPLAARMGIAARARALEMCTVERFTARMLSHYHDLARPLPA